MQTTDGMTRLPPLGWRCNGSINPLIRSSDQLRQVAGEEFREAVRWCAIHLHTYKLPGLPAAAEDIMTNGGDWGTVGENVLEHIARRYLDHRQEPRWKRNTPIAHAKGQELMTIAQVVAAYGGTDSKAGCQDLADLIAAVTVAGSYNDFDSREACRELVRFNRLRYYNPDNPNNGGDLFKYHIAWEGSLALYISCNFVYPARFLSPSWREAIELAPGEFQVICRDLGRRLHADENEACRDEPQYVTWRLWWD